jgi:hypothetical protein
MAFDWLKTVGGNAFDYVKNLDTDKLSVGASLAGAGADLYSGYQDRKQGDRLAQENIDLIRQRNQADESMRNTQLALNKRQSDRERDSAGVQARRALSDRQALQDLSNTAKGIKKKKRRTLGGGAGFVGGF